MIPNRALAQSLTRLSRASAAERSAAKDVDRDRREAQTGEAEQPTQSPQSVSVRVMFSPH